MFDAEYEIMSAIASEALDMVKGRSWNASRPCVYENMTETFATDFVNYVYFDEVTHINTSYEQL